MNCNNVIIFGESGVGKSTLVNAIINKECGDEGAAKTSDRVVGCTFEWKEYNYKYDNININIYDTAGLSEASRGTVPNEKATDYLVELIQELSNSGGVSLLIMCIKRYDKITDTLCRNYALFSRGICQDQVPIILAVTGCENDTKEVKSEYLSDTYNKYEEADLNVVEIVCVGIPKEGPLVSATKKVELRNKSKDDILASIQKHLLKTPWKMQSTIQWITGTFAILWNIGADFWQFPLKMSVDVYIQNALIKCGVSEDEAIRIATKIKVSLIGVNTMTGKLVQTAKNLSLTIKSILITVNEAWKKL